MEIIFALVVIFILGFVVERWPSEPAPFVEYKSYDGWGPH